MSAIDWATPAGKSAVSKDLIGKDLPFRSQGYKIMWCNYPASEIESDMKVNDQQRAKHADQFKKNAKESPLPIRTTRGRPHAAAKCRRDCPGQKLVIGS